MKMFSNLWQYISEFFLVWEMFQINIVEKIKTHILCSVTFFSPENHDFYEIMWKNMMETESRRWQYNGALHDG